MSLRVLVLGVERKPRYPDAEGVALTALFQLALTTSVDGQAYDWDGCLSEPGIRGKVPHGSRPRVHGLPFNGE